MTLLHSGELFYFWETTLLVAMFDMILPAQCYDVEKGHFSQEGVGFGALRLKPTFAFHHWRLGR